MGRRKAEQDELFTPTARGAGHKFYEALSQLLRDADFDVEVERLCAPYYAPDDGRGGRSIPPGVFFRMMLVGYFEGISSERGIVWRCGDSMSLRDFLGLPNHKAVPNQSTLSRTRYRLPLKVFDEVFRLVLRVVDENGLFKGKVFGVDSTYLKADASMKTIVRKDTGENHREYIKRIAAEDLSNDKVSDDKASDDKVSDEKACDDKASDDKVSDDKASDDKASDDKAASTSKKVSTEEAVRYDRKRKKTTSNKDWASKSDSDARIVRMKNGTTRLGYKAEHVVDMDTGAIVALTLFKGNEGDTSTLMRSLQKAEENLAPLGGLPNPDDNDGEAWHRPIKGELVADKGYHKVSVLDELKKEGWRTYIPERKHRGKRRFDDKGGASASQAFHQNRARTRRKKGKEHQRRRGEFVERPNQHLYERGQKLRELSLVGQENNAKRLAVQAMGFNLGLVMRKNVGAGTPKGLWLALSALLAAICVAARNVEMNLGRTFRYAVWRQERRRKGAGASVC